MTRFTKWQREVSDAVSWHQDQALNATIFLLRETGPTSFILKEEEVEKRVRVTLGDPHTCTCDVFRKENVPCKHICWVILKKFKWPRYNELAIQHGLVEREINLLLRGPRNATRAENTANKDKKREKGDEKGALKQREITEVDVCPICQEELLIKHTPVTYCKFGCGNSIHIKCMKVWAEHQRNSTQDNEIKCPICRASFGSYFKLLEELRNSSGENDSGLDIHFSTSCHGCSMSPIKGKCYKCVSCELVYLCNTCFHGNKHRQHAFEFRFKRSQRWRQAKSRNINSALEISIINDLGSREITEDDYDLLLQLENREQSQAVDLSGLPLHVINSLPLLKVRVGGRLLAPGKQCRICLRNYEVGQLVRKLPDCKHIFHKDCIDPWLSEDHRRCPIDQTLVNMYKKPTATQEMSPDSNHNYGDAMELIVPGVGIAKLKNYPSQLNPTPPDSHVIERSTDTVTNFTNFNSENHALYQQMLENPRNHDENQYNPSTPTVDQLSRRNCRLRSRQDSENNIRVSSAASRPQANFRNMNSQSGIRHGQGNEARMGSAASQSWRTPHKRDSQSGPQHEPNNTIRINSAAASQPQTNSRVRYGSSYSIERDHTDSQIPQHHLKEPEQVTRQLSGISVSKMLDTIDGVWPRPKRQASNNKNKYGIEKGLVSRRNIAQYTDQNQTADSSLWLQGNSMSHNDSGTP